jgi:hypothetical protein
METRLSALGYAMVPRADGNGAEVGGVGQDVMDLFSSRAVAVTGELGRLAREYQSVHGRPPSRRTLWLLHQQAGQNTRRTKAQARRFLAGQTGATEPTAAQRLAAWEAQTVHRELSALSAVHEQWAGSPPSTPGAHGRCWMMRPSAPPRGSRGPRCNATTPPGRWRSCYSRCTGHCRCSRLAPTARRWSPRWPSARPSGVERFVERLAR